MYLPIDIPAGLKSDNTALAASPGWFDCNNMRFRLGRAQTIGGWESLTLSLLTGVCRTVFPWTDNTASPQLNVAFGTHSDLQLYLSGLIYTITPTLAAPATLLGTNPFASVNTSTTVTVTHDGHGRTTGDTITFPGAVNFNNLTLSGTFTLTVVDSGHYTIVSTTAANATGVGGGGAVVGTPQAAYAAGAIDGTGTSGFGTGAFGAGPFGQASSADYFPRTWSLAAWGQNLLASYRGGTIYGWTNNTASVAQPLQNAPAQVTYMLVSPQRQVFALGCSQEIGGVFNALTIRHSDVGSNTGWSSIATSASTSREYTLPGGGRIVAGRVMGKYLLIWTTQALWLGTYVGQVGQVWRFDKVGDRCGLIGPNAAAVAGSTAFWMSPDRQFHSYTLGGAVSAVECPIREDFAQHLSPSQADKIVCSTIAEFSEVRWDYPDARDGVENSRYLALSVAGSDVGSWYRGQMARTAMVDAGPAQYPIGVTYGGNIYSHEKGNSADGGALSWSIETAFIYLDDNYTALARKLMPDFTDDQLGSVTLSILSRLFPQSADVTAGPYMIAPGQSEVDILATGRLFKMIFSGSSAQAYARIGVPLIDAKQRGRR